MSRAMKWLGLKLSAFHHLQTYKKSQRRNRMKYRKERKKTEEVATKPELPTPAVVTLTDQQARSALLSFVSGHFCYGSGAAKQMRITSMDYVPAHHYELQTFTEKRETNWAYAPHKGLDLDSATSGRAPLPWEVDEPPLSMFKEEVRMVTVPHTGVVKTCHKCRGSGGMTCGECYGKVRTFMISGFGYNKNDRLEGSFKEPFKTKLSE